MACGVPVIAAVNSRMLDLLHDGNCIALRRQSPVVDRTGAALPGWGESDVDKMVAALEFAYEQRAQAREIGLQARAWLLANGRTWQAHARELSDWLLMLR